jgi:hypothetical protein
VAEAEIPGRFVTWFIGYGPLLGMALGVTLFQCLLTSQLARLRSAGTARLLAPVALGYALLLILRPPNLLLSNAAVLVISAVGARGLAGILRGRGAVLGFSGAASVADIVSFFAGPTRHLLDGAETGAGSVVSYLAFSVPVGESVLPVLGAADLLFVGVYFLVLGALGATGRTAVALPTVGMLLALAVGLWMGGAPGIPFLAGVSAAYLLLRSRARRTG